MNQKGFATIIFVIVILIASMSIVGASLYIKNLTIPKTNNPIIQPYTNRIVVTPIPIASPSANLNITNTNEEEEIVRVVISAMKDYDWQTLYYLVSSDFQGENKEAFIKFMQAQEAEIGRVVEVEILSKPVVQIKPVSGTKKDIKFFTIRTKTTYEKNGRFENYEFTDYYIQEKDKWKFWFSSDK